MEFPYLVFSAVLYETTTLMLLSGTKSKCLPNFENISIMPFVRGVESWDCKTGRTEWAVVTFCYLDGWMDDLSIGIVIGWWFMAVMFPLK